MTPKERLAMQQALEALEELHYSSGTVVAVRKYESATAALREALEQPVNQEPVAWHHPQCDGQCIACLIEKAVEDAYGTQGRDYMLRHINAAPQPVSEPVAWLWVSKHGIERLEWEPVEDISKWKSVPLYTAPQPVKEVEALVEVLQEAIDGMGGSYAIWEPKARAVIAEYKEKSCGE